MSNDELENIDPSKIHDQMVRGLDWLEGFANGIRRVDADEMLSKHMIHRLDMLRKHLKQLRSSVGY